MHKIIIAAIMFLGTSHINAAPYIELGLAKGDGAACIRDWKAETNTYGCSSSPLGNVTIGYEWKGFHAEVEHWSSLQDKDYGLNLFTIKYRYTFK